MNASTIINDDMTLEEKLAAIEKAVKDAQAAAVKKAKKHGIAPIAIDPAELTVCEGCQ